MQEFAHPAPSKKCLNQIIHNCHYEKVGENIKEINLDLPQGWEFSRLSLVCWLNNGEKSEGEKLPYLDARTLRGKNDKTYLESGIIVNEGEKVILVDGENSGEVFIVPYRGYMGSTFKILQMVSLINVEYIKIILDYYKEILKESKTGAAIPHLNKQLLKSIIIGVPPIEEQDRIVNQVQQIMQYIDLLENNQNEYADLVEILKKAVLQSAIQGNLVEQVEDDEPASVLLEKIRAEKKAQLGKKYIESYIYKGVDNRYYEHIGSKAMDITQDIPFKLPKNWQWSKLKYIAFTQTGSTPPTEDEENFGDFIPFIKPGDIIDSKINYHNEGLSNKGLLNGRLIKKHSILMVCIGGSLGKCAILDRDVSCNQQINTATTNGSILPLYIFYVLNSDYFQSTAIEKATGNATPILNKSSWENIFIPVPPLAEQERIVNKINEIFAQL